MDFTALHPPVVRVAPKVFTYRAAGEYLKDGMPVSAPLVRARLSRPLHVMQFHVTRRQYRLCVDEGICAKPFEAYIRMDGTEADSDYDEPVTGVSYEDVLKYANWLSEKTGERWRLPTDVEWAAFAAERYYDDQLSEPDDPLKDTISKPEIYKFETRRDEISPLWESDPVPKKPGFYGANSLGIYDLSGNIWEWTQTCYERHWLNSKTGVAEVSDLCGVLVIEGRQRAYMSSFLQDPASGECTVTNSPDNLGLRLVRDGTATWAEKARLLFAD